MHLTDFHFYVQGLRLTDKTRHHDLVDRKELRAIRNELGERYKDLPTIRNDYVHAAESEIKAWEAEKRTLDKPVSMPGIQVEEGLSGSFRARNATRDGLSHTHAAKGVVELAVDEAEVAYLGQVIDRLYAVFAKAITR